MKRFLIIAIVLPVIAWAGTQQPPFEEKSWETNENMRQAYIEIDNLKTLVESPSLPVVDVTISTPTAIGRIVRTSSGVVYISTNTVNVGGWWKVGSQ